MDLAICGWEAVPAVIVLQIELGPRTQESVEA